MKFLNWETLSNFDWQSPNQANVTLKLALLWVNWIRRFPENPLRLNCSMILLCDSKHLTRWHLCAIRSRVRSAFGLSFFFWRKAFINSELFLSSPSWNYSVLYLGVLNLRLHQLSYGSSTMMHNFVARYGLNTSRHRQCSLLRISFSLGPF